MLDSPRRTPLLFAVPLVVALAVTALAQTGATISLTVDATQVAAQHWIHTHLVMPVAPGPLTLYYPKWIPGEHEPDGPIANLTGLTFKVNGKTIPWRRSLADVFTFRVDIPPDGHELDADFDYLEPGTGGSSEYSGAASSTDKLAVISWNQNLLYPTGTPAQQLTYAATLRLPSGWRFGTALPVASQSGNKIAFQPVSLNRLVDSPVLAGEYFRAIDLTPPGEPIHHEIDLAADSAAALALSPQVQQELTNLVAETGKLFGTRHYRDYHFLLTLSDHVAHFGLEHHESDDSRLPERVLLSPAGGRIVGELLPHEFVHSWNGKFRRPQDLSSAYYEAPMQTDMLWVYEGLTDFLGNVLATRSGLWTQNDYHQFLAETAAELGPGRPGRTWRPLLDTAVAVPGMFDFVSGWMNWRRGTDYYEEGDLLWLEVATILHQQSGGRKSLADFCRLFYGGPNNGPELKPYTFDDLVAALNSIVPYDWAGFFHDRLDSTSPAAPLNGIQNSGWEVVYTDEPQGGFGGMEYSLGLAVGRDGTVFDSVVGSPAFTAGVTSGMRIIGVNGHAYTAAGLADALQASSSGTQPLQLLVVNNDYYHTVTIDYHQGARAPRLIRISNQPDYLDDLLSPGNG